MNSYHAPHARPPTIAKTTTAKGREIRAVAGATVTASDDALTGSEDGVVANAKLWATRPSFTNSQTPTPNPMSAPRGPMLKKAPIATPPSRSGPANAITRNARPNHPASMPTTPERKPRTIRIEYPTFVLGYGRVDDFTRLLAMAKPPYQLESAS